MIKFTWKCFKDGTGVHCVDWQAEWDGRIDNDPLVDTPENKKDYPHPFSATLDFVSDRETEKWLKETGRWVDYYKSFEEFQENYSFEKVNSVGDIVADNKAVRAICEMIEDDEMIKKYSGHTDPYWYRMNLLGCLSRLWD